MATSAATLIQRSRRFIGDWPENDALGASVTANATTLTVADATIYSPGWIIQVDNEGMYVSSAVGTTITVRRGIRGTTAATHASAATILIRPHFLDIEYLDGLNAGIDACWPLVYQPVVDETTTTTNSTYEYTIPSLNGTPIPYISYLQFKESGDLAFRKFTAWDILRGATPKVKLRRPLPIGTLRFYGFGPIPQLVSLTDTLSAYFPPYAEEALTYFCSQFLMASGETRRVREDTGARDDRENANRVGGSLAISTAMYQRFQARLLAAALPPMPKTVISAL